MELSQTRIQTKEKVQLFTPAAIFLILGLLVGIFYSVLIPYGAGFDEEMHQMRIVDITFRHMLPNRGVNDATPTFIEFLDLSYQRRYFNDPANDMFSPEKFLVNLDLEKIIYLKTRSIYSPVMFLPEALVAYVGLRLFNLPVIPVTIVERLAGLLVYLLGAYFAIRLIPFGKWLFAALALAPMAMFQASTLSADGFTNAACFLFIGLTLKLAYDKERPLRALEVWGLAASCLMIGLSKPGYFMLLPLVLIIPRSRFPSKKLYALMWAGVALSVAVTFGWMAVSVAHSQFANDASQSLTNQLGVILGNPVPFLSAYFKGIISSLDTYYTDWVGVYGYWVGVVPQPIYWIFPLGLLVSLLSEPPARNITWKTRLVLFSLFLISTGAIIFLYSYIHYSPGVDEISGRQGRYYIPTAPLLFLALAGWVSLRTNLQKAARYLTLALIVVAIGFYSLGLYATYYLPCGYSTFSGQSCLLPQYKNLNKTSTAPSYLVTAQTPLSQTFTNRCGKISSVSVFIKTIPGEAQGSLLVSLLDSNHQRLASKEFPLNEIEAGNYLTLPVKPAVGSEGALYEIRMEAPALGANNGVSIMTRKAHYYQEGQVFAAGKPYARDTVFHYTCPNRDQQ